LLYVKDTVCGFEAVAKTNSLIGEEVNLATQSEISIGEVANTLISMINPGASILKAPERIRPEKSEVFRLFGSNDKMMKHTNWQPIYTFQNALKETVAWFSEKENLKRYKADIYNI
jgi:nucleoside-diphosphate-sugar epimerase